jgi:hypothetical protein
MVDTVPNGVQLTEVVTPLSVKVSRPFDRKRNCQPEHLVV